MTITGHQNHYNIKSLKGYGFSVNVKDNKLVFKDSHDPFKEPEMEEHYITNLPYEKTVLSGRGYISTEAIDRTSIVLVIEKNIINYYLRMIITEIKSPVHL